MDRTGETLQDIQDSNASPGANQGLKSRDARKVAPRGYCRVGDLWPGGVIPYCFENQKAKDSLSSIFQSALTEWQNAWKRHLPDKPFPVQFRSRGVAGDSGSDCKIDSVDLVMIQWTDINEFTSHVGYKKGMQRDLILHDQHDYLLANVVHEIGHIMGLLHEHQRPDAAEYVTFLCQNLFDYQEMVDKYEGPGGYDKGYVEKMLCTNAERARIAGFSARAFAVAVAATEDETPDQPLRESKFDANAFDFNSVMIYPSWAFTKGYDTDISDYLPTLKRVTPIKVGGHDSYEIVQKGTPSRGDITFINSLYDGVAEHLDITIDLHGLSLSEPVDPVQEKH